MKLFNVHNVYKMDNAVYDGELYLIATAVISIQKLIIAWYMEF